ncbi:MAG TPA: SNF2-related protein, partial [Planctomycetaceae bacterium]
MGTSSRRWLDDLLRQHENRVARRGREYVGRVGTLRYDSETGSVVCQVAGSGEEPYVVTLRPSVDERGRRSDGTRGRRITAGREVSPSPPLALSSAHAATGLIDTPLDASCTCPYNEEGRFLCKHTFAAATRLAELCDARPDASLDELLNGDGPSARPAARPLQLLDAFLNESGDGESASGEPTGRLCWLVKPHRGGPFGAGLSVRVVAETWLGGQWRRSEPLPWDRVIDSLDSPDLVATPQDREAVLAVRRDQQSYGFHPGKKPLWTIDTFALLAALVGHPRVFLAERDTESRPLEVTAGTLGLAVVVREEGLGVVPAVNGTAAVVTSLDAGSTGDRGGDGAEGRRGDGKNGSVQERLPLSPSPSRSFVQADATAPASSTTFFPGLSGVLALDRANGRLVVAEAEPKARRLVAALRPEETVPFVDAEDLVARLVRVESLLPVTWPEELKDGRSAADGRIRVRLERLDPFGLSVRLAVRPAEGSEAFAPGAGPAVVPVCERGRRAERVRDLDAERQEAEAVADVLGLLGAARPKPWRWVVEDPEAALRVVERLPELDPERAAAEWPSGEPVRIVGAASANAVRVRVGESRDWFRLEGGAEIDGRAVPLPDLLTAVAEGRDYIPLSATEWVKLTDDLRTLLVALGETASASPSEAVRVPRSAAPAAARVLGPIGRFMPSRAWTTVTEAVAEEGEPELPGGLRARLRPYQLDGYRWLARRSDADLGCCLADEMGLGKTVQTLAVLLRRADRGAALVAAPTSVEPNWLAEAERFAPSLRVQRLRDLDDDRLAALGPGDVLLATHELLRRRADELEGVRWTTLVLDEAHAVKNPETRLADAVRRLRPAWTLALTGTPVENHPGELWAVFHLLAPDLLGPWTRFRKRFAEPVAAGDRTATETLRRLIGPYLLRRTKESVLPDLPPRIETTRLVEPSEPQRSFYEAARQAALAELEGDDPDRRLLLAALTKLRQIAAHPALADPTWTGDSPKLDEIVAV